MNNYTRNTIIVLGCTIVDQALKAVIQYTHASINFGLFFIHEIRNTGASFGMLQGNNSILIFISMIALGIIGFNINKIPKKYQVPVSLLAAGIIGNLIDRIFRGYVVDFFDLGWWPAFNLADSCIFIGVFWVAILLIKEDLEHGKKSKTLKKTKK